MKKLLLIIFLLGSLPSFGFHIAGGDLTTEWLGGNNFRLRLTVYRDCSNPNAAYFDPTIIIGVYTKNGDVLQDSFHVDLTSVNALQLAGPGCANPPSVCMEQGDYIRNIQLPPSSGGYYLVWERCCRNSAVINLAQADQTPMLFYHEMTDPAIQNNSPVFNSPPLPFTCAGSFFRFNFAATDADGDSLAYSLSTPMAGGYTDRNNPNLFSSLNSQGGGNLVPESRPYADAIWATGYGLGNICGGTLPVSIDAVTGVTEGIPGSPGLYAMAVNVYEYRNGQLIGMVRREIEFTVISCTGNNAPNLPPAIQNASYEIFATDTLTFIVNAADADGDSVFLSHSGNVFSASPAPGLVPPYAVSNDTSGTDSVKVQFFWPTTCNQSRDSVYHVTYEISDNGCPLPLTALAQITIRIKPVPIVERPNLLCLGLTPNSITVFKNPDTSILSRYFGYYTVYRSTNGGAFIPIGQFSDPTQYSFTDPTVSASSNDNYCYYITGTNSCGITSEPSDTICSIDQINTSANYLVSASVDSKNRIRLTWEDFPDGPFSTLIIERKTEIPGGTWSEVKRLNAYTFSYWDDLQVETDRFSYCYRLKNINFCGNESEWSNDACTILLKAEKLAFTHLLEWTPYSEWPAGIKEYRLMRMDASSAFLNIAVTIPAEINYKDYNLSDEVGIYRYKVIAKEADGGFDAESHSNEVEIIQAPLLYVPGAFSPNGDAYNNQWKAYGAFISDFHLVIYNRWGQSVFESNDIEQGWEGQFQDTLAPEGVYAWKILYSGFNNGKTLEKRGTVLLLR